MMTSLFCRNFRFLSAVVYNIELAMLLLWSNNFRLSFFAHWRKYEVGIISETIWALKICVLLQILKNIDVSELIAPFRNLSVVDECPVSDRIDLWFRIRNVNRWIVMDMCWYECNVFEIRLINIRLKNGQ